MGMGVVVLQYSGALMEKCHSDKAFNV